MDPWGDTGVGTTRLMSFRSQSLLSKAGQGQLSSRCVAAASNSQKGWRRQQGWVLARRSLDIAGACAEGWCWHWAFERCGPFTHGRRGVKGQRVPGRLVMGPEEKDLLGVGGPGKDTWGADAGGPCRHPLHGEGLSAQSTAWARAGVQRSTGGARITVCGAMGWWPGAA